MESPAKETDEVFRSSAVRSSSPTDYAARSTTSCVGEAVPDEGEMEGKPGRKRASCHLIARWRAAPAACDTHGIPLASNEEYQRRRDEVKGNIALLMERERAYRSMIHDDATSKLDVMYLTHCHSQLAIETQLCRYPGCSTNHRSVIPSFIYERTSESVFLSGLATEKLEKVQLLEELSRVKIEAAAFVAPSVMWGLSMIDIEEAWGRSQLVTRYHRERFVFEESFSRYLDDGLLFRQYCVGQYRLEQEERIVFAAIKDQLTRKTAIVDALAPVFAEERNVRSEWRELEKAERIKLVIMEQSSFSDSLARQGARATYQLSIINNCQQQVRGGLAAGEIVSRYLIRLHLVEALAVRRRISRDRREQQFSLIVVDVLDTARAELEVFIGELHSTTDVLLSQIAIMPLENVEVAHTHNRARVVVIEAIARCMLMVEINEALARLEITKDGAAKGFDIYSEFTLHRIVIEEASERKSVMSAIYAMAFSRLEIDSARRSTRVSRQESQSWEGILREALCERMKILEATEQENRQQICNEFVIEHADLERRMQSRNRKAVRGGTLWECYSPAMNNALATTHHELQQCAIMGSDECLQDELPVPCIKACCRWLCKGCFLSMFNQDMLTFKCTECSKTQPFESFITPSFIPIAAAYRDTVELLKHVDVQLCRCGAIVVNETMYAQKHCGECGRLFCFFCNNDWDETRMDKSRRYGCCDACSLESRVSFEPVKYTFGSGGGLIPNRRICPNCFELGGYGGTCKFHECRRCSLWFCFWCLQPKANHPATYNLDCTVDGKPVAQTVESLPRLCRNAS